MHRWRRIEAKERDSQRRHQHVLYGGMVAGHRATFPLAKEGTGAPKYELRKATVTRNKSKHDVYGPPTII